MEQGSRLIEKKNIRFEVQAILKDGSAVGSATYMTGGYCKAQQVAFEMGFLAARF